MPAGSAGQDMTSSLCRARSRKVLPSMSDPVHAALVTLTLRLKVRSESYAWLNAAAVEVNQVWNFCNENAASVLGNLGKWLSGFDLCYRTAGSSQHMERIGADTIQRVCTEYAAKRNAVRKPKLRWRVSRGARRSLGWVPFKAASLKRRGNTLRFCGRTLRVFERDCLEGVKWRDGCFAQDAVGDWWLSLPVAVNVEPSIAPREAVGIDLGLKAVATTSDGDRLDAARFYRDAAQKIAQAQRRGHKRQAKRFVRRRAAEPTRSTNSLGKW